MDKTDSHQLSSDFHMFAMAYVPVCVHTHVHKINVKTKQNKM